MHTRIVSGLMAAFAWFAASGGASAAILHFGCQAQVGDKQVIFNRYSMVIVDTKQKMGDIRKLPREKIELPPGSPPSVAYEPASDYDAIAKDATDKVLEFTRSDDPKRKVILTEKSSRLISHKHLLICGRDDDTDVYRKTFSYQREDEPARDITMQCLWYQLSTRGGRKGCGSDD